MKNNFKTKIDKNIVTFYEKELGQVGQPNEKGWYKALCPFHDDTKPSLSINLIHGGYRCRGRCKESGNIVQFYMKSHNVDKKTAIIRLEQMGIKRKNFQKPDKVYNYRSEDGGKILFQICRFEPKDFRMRRLDGKGGWIWNVKGVEPVPYHLKNVLKAHRKESSVRHMNNFFPFLQQKIVMLFNFLNIYWTKVL